MVRSVSLLVILGWIASAQADCCLCNECAPVIVQAQAKGEFLRCDEFAGVVFDLFEASSSQCLEVQQQQQASCCPEQEVQEKSRRGLAWTATSGWPSSSTSSNIVSWGKPKPAYQSFSNSIATPAASSFSSTAFGRAPARKPATTTTYSAALNCNVDSSRGTTVVQYTHFQTGQGYQVRCNDATRGVFPSVPSQVTNLVKACARVNCCQNFGGGAGAAACGKKATTSTGQLSGWSAYSGGPRN